MVTREYLKKQHAINEEEAAETAQEENTESYTNTGESVKCDLDGKETGKVDFEKDAKQARVNRENLNMNVPQNNRSAIDRGANNKYDKDRSHLIFEHPNMKVPKDDGNEEIDHFDPGRDSNEADFKGKSTLKGSDNYSVYDPSQINQSNSYSVSQSTQSKAALIAKHLNTGKIDLDATVDVDDEDDMDGFRPHILHHPHSPCPIAMVNRRPTGSGCPTPRLFN